MNLFLHGLYFFSVRIMPQMHVGNCRFYMDPYCYHLTISSMVHTLFYANFTLNPIWTLFFYDFYEAMFIKCCSLVLSIVGKLLLFGIAKIVGAGMLLLHPNACYFVDSFYHS